MSTPTWIPAPKRGMIPLHPLDFGTILGRSFAMLRHNPAVLLGFAVCVQLAVNGLAMILFAVFFVSSMNRVDTLAPDSADFDAVMAGTIGVSVLIALLMMLLSTAVGAAVQGVVAANLRTAVLGERLRLAAVWLQVKPVFWRLIGYTLLLGLAMGVALTILLCIAFAIALGLGAALDTTGYVIGVIVGVLLLLGYLATTIWVGTKILLTPTVLVLEHTTIFAAIRRSWLLVRGRFWVAFGATALISLIVGAAASAVSGVTQLFAMLLLPVLMPTGDPFQDEAVSPSTILSFTLLLLLPQLLTLVISAVGTVAQNTAAGLVYLDARMRSEGLDQSLMWHVEHRAVGWATEQLPDPYAVPRYSTTPPPMGADLQRPV